MATVPQEKPQVLDPRRLELIRLMEAIDAASGIVGEPSVTPEQLQQRMIANGVRPEDNIGGTEQGASMVYGIGDLSRQGWNLIMTGRVQFNKSVAAIDQKLYARAAHIPGATFPTSFRA